MKSGEVKGEPRFWRVMVKRWGSSKKAGTRRPGRPRCPREEGVRKGKTEEEQTAQASGPQAETLATHSGGCLPLTSVVLAEPSLAHPQLAGLPESQL